ncbi:hypothetical protein LTR56_015561 [Elasticomyces elasticus]|nr:hypothetical protein LTR56_015561 [Elasticomyces elasticus]KAK3648290.1 hypothetical protein LTR22_013421 [Elasticomyces elasticus]KAK4916280.1 hypothetical protein LTR49_015652 [Elasticomyces elasticus]KAK5764960.1 hypothetical protein LTS12_004988 [Elasticomyces elasticus]
MAHYYTTDLVRLTKLETTFSADSYCIRHPHDVAGTGHRSIRKEVVWKRDPKPFGIGGQGEVHREVCIEGDVVGAVRAVKSISKPLSESARKVNYANELQTVAHFSKRQYEDSFVNSFGWFETSDAIFIAMEFVPLGDLTGHLKVPFPAQEAGRITAQVLRGLDYMHIAGYAHRDLKPSVQHQNLLVFATGPHWHVKIADFGLSKRVLGDASSLRTHAGTLGYMAPEMLGLGPGDDDSSDEDQKTSYTNAVDIWAVGVMAYLMLTMQMPFLPSEPRALGKYARGKTSLPSRALVDNVVSRDGQAFIRILLSPWPADRPSAQGAQEHEWLVNLHTALPSQAGSKPSQSVASSEVGPGTTVDSGYHEGHTMEIIDDHRPQGHPATAQWTAIDSAFHEQHTVQSRDPSRPHDQPTAIQWTQNRKLKRQSRDSQKPKLNPRYTTASWTAALASESHKRPAMQSQGDSYDQYDPDDPTERARTARHSAEALLADPSDDVDTPALVQREDHVPVKGNTLEERQHLGHSPSSQEEVSSAPVEKYSPSKSDISTYTASFFDDSGKASKPNPWHLLAVLKQADFNYQATLTFSSDGRYVASASDIGRVRIWSVASPEISKRLSGPTRVSGNAQSIAVSADGHILATSVIDQKIKLWNVATGQWYLDIDTRPHVAASVCFSLDGKVLVAALPRGVLRAWDTATGLNCWSLRVSDGSPYDDEGCPIFALAPKGGTMASMPSPVHRGGRKTLWTIKLLDPVQGKLLKTRDCNTCTALLTTTSGESYCSPFSLAFSPSGRELAMSETCGNVTLCNITTRSANKVIENYALQTPLYAYVAFWSDDMVVGAGCNEAQTQVALRCNLGTTKTTVMVPRRSEGLKCHNRAVSQDGKQVAFAHVDDTISVWKYTEM